MKAPVKGDVKTRIASGLGQEFALDLYKNFVLDILQTLERLPYPFRICFYPPDSRHATECWIGSRYRYYRQEGFDLGEKMEKAFLQAFSEGLHRAVLIGSDVPDLKGELIDQAFGSLETNDIVLGPAADGGYYLIGFNAGSFLPAAFRGISWSSGSVLRETLSVLRQASRRIHLLPQWHDVDVPADLDALVRRNEGTAFKGSRTMRFLAASRERWKPRRE